MRKPDLTLRLAAVAVIAAAAAYVGAAMFGAADAGENRQTDKAYAADSAVELDGLVLRQETVILFDGTAAYPVPAEGEFVSGGDVLYAENGDAYFSALDKGIDYEGKTVCSPVSGYFCTDLDGLEAASVSDYPELSPHIPENALCRIVYGASWYFAAETPDGAFIEGDIVTLTLLRSYSATVQSAQNGVVVFRVREGLYSVLSLRYATATVTK